MISAPSSEHVKSGPSSVDVVNEEFIPQTASDHSSGLGATGPTPTHEQAVDVLGPPKSCSGSGENLVEHLLVESGEGNSLVHGSYFFVD